jgi:uncharacterized membrane protein
MKIIKNLFLLIFLLLIINFSLLIAAPAAQAEQIDNFDVIIKINQDSSIDVTERIDYNFGNLNRHGIYRDIPYKYKARGGNFKLHISDFEITDINGQEYTHKISNQLKYKRIKIGDADKTVSGNRTYVISYKVERAMNYFDDHDELYWNVTGNEWDVPIIKSSALIITPESVSSNNIAYKCFSGKIGSKAECTSSNIKYSKKGEVANVLFENDYLSNREGLTAVLSIPKGAIYEPNIFEKLLEIFKNNLIFLLPMLVLFFLYKKWQVEGKDPEGRGVIVAQFDAPDGLTPAQVGTVYDEVVHRKDVSALLISLAIKGYLKITRIEDDAVIFKTTDYLFERLNESAEKDLKRYEKEMLDALFTKKNIKDSIKDMKMALAKYDKADNNNFVYNLLVKYINHIDIKHNESEKKDVPNIVKLSSLKNTFASKYQKIENHIYDSLVDDGHFPKNPKKVRGLYTVVGVVFSFTSFFFGAILMPIFGIFGIISWLLTGLMIIIFGVFMPVKTKLGVETREHILGLKKYLEVAEKDRIKFHNAPEKNPEQFEKLLPYAMVLGVEKQWAKQFEGIYDQEPSWYSGAGRFNSVALTSSLGSFQATTNNTMMSTASGGGSGFSGGSGGGGGGGGGGSW